MFEIDGVSEDVAQEALRLAAMKLPIKNARRRSRRLVKPAAPARAGDVALKWENPR